MLHKHTSRVSPADVLRAHGFRVTTGRTKLLELLARAGTPLSIQKLHTLLRGTQDQATLYRTLTDLAAAGIVQRADMNTGTAHFEYTPGREHHHHVVCTDCGTVEDIDECALDELEHKITKRAKKFVHISSHNLEFFGQCVGCSR
ncbi:MAG: Ferric uptake regulator, Fur family [Candidatus Parcubacteria bacterium]|jgi:Fe2+ or Zn2+ uptake regulation protein